MSKQGARQKIEKGDRVTLAGLKTTRFNGKNGTVVSLPNESSQGRFGIRVDGTHAPIAIQRNHLVFLQSATQETGKEVAKSTRQLKEERDHLHGLTRLSKEESVNADGMAMMRMMMNMFATEEHQIKMFGRKIDPMPDFRSELMNEGGGIPIAVDRTWANDYLRLAYEHASSLPHMFEMHFKRADYEPQASDFFKRLCTNDATKLEWYFSGLQPGTIFTKREAHPYNDYSRHSFSNQAYRKEKLHQGRTHVAIGFVDLGLLFAADLADGSGPLRFIGIDMSAYAVAKTHVVWELLKQTPSSSPERKEHERRIMQVWFSTTWAEGTESVVKAALSTLCSSEKAYHPAVRKIIDHWFRAPTFPLKKARREYASATTDARSSIGHLLKKRDRISMAKYELAGDFGVKDRPVCGNTIMFDCPDGTPPLGTDETVFSALSWRDVMGIVLRNRDLTIMEAAEAYALDGISKLAAWSCSGAVVVELKCARFEDEIDEIASAKPWTMSWSNVLDYVDYGHFHTLAQKCSRNGDTIHFGYSMNWATHVWGTNIIDFHGEGLAEARAELLETSNANVKTTYELFGWDDHLRQPPPDNPINTTSFNLELLHYKTWSKYFFDIARREGSPCQVANVEHAICSPLSRTGSSSVSFTWTYDPDVHFNNLW